MPSIVAAQYQPAPTRIGPLAIASGGGISSSANAALHLTLGQTMIGETRSDQGSIALGLGFWHVSGPVVPIAVQDFQVLALEGSVQLSWRLSATTVRELEGLRVQRAVQLEGPYIELLSSPLSPEESMSFEDSQTSPATTYWYRLVLVDQDGPEVALSPVRVTTPEGPRFTTAFFAPFEVSDGHVQLRYEIGDPGLQVAISIYDVRGRLAARLDRAAQQPGRYLYKWNRTDANGVRAARGVYLVRFHAGTYAATKKLVLVH